jgi:hypothetical protein
MRLDDRLNLDQIDRRPVLDAETVKAYASALGAHLVGIASADTLNAFPPDPLYPQTPERISTYCKSIIVIAQRIPTGAFRCKQNVPVQYLDMLVLRHMDKIAYRLVEWLERKGHPSFVAAAQETDWSYKIPENSEAREVRLAAMTKAEADGSLPPDYQAQTRWIGDLAYLKGRDH